MTTEAGMDGAGTRQGFGGAVSRRLVVEMALRWRALFLAVVLLPGAAWGEQTAHEILKERRDHELWKDGGGCPGAERYLKAFPEGLHADEARECPTERRAEEIVLPDGLTLADWALMAEDRLKAGDHARLLEEAGAHLREYGPIESVEEIREQAVTGLTAELRVTTREDAPGALERIARLEAAAGERPELLYLKGRAHGLLGDHAAAEAAYLQWLRSVPQTHPERRDVLSALARARAARDKTQRFTELLGRPFSAELKTDAAGWTDLHYAALLDLPGVVAALCDAGMDADVRLKSGSPPFGDDLKRTLAALGYEGFKRWNANGETPLMMASLGNARNAAAALVDCGADVNPKHNNGWTPLHFAAEGNAPDMAKLLLERGTDVEAKTNNGWTPLHNAAWKNSLDVAKLLIDRGADMDAKEENGWRPLHIAARDNSLDVAKLLIDRGADVNQKNSNGNTILDIALEKGHREMQALLRLHGAATHEAEERREHARQPGDTFRDCPECPEMVVVPGGQLGRPFAVGVHEVTFAEWDACVSGGGCGGYRPGDEGWGRGNRPVINVSWKDAQAYVRWLSERTGAAYRLPSEAEWEYVARAGTTTDYWWGDDIGRNRANCTRCGSRWDGRQTAPVGSFSANLFGLYDVHGNVWEWVEDCAGDCRRRVLRSGSWFFGPRNLRSAYRYEFTSDYRSNQFGLRVARTLTP